METTVRYLWLEGQHLHAILEETMEHRCVNRSQSEANFYLRPLRQPQALCDMFCIKLPTPFEIFPLF